MKTEYRVILTATFDTSTDRDTAYTALKNAIQNWTTNNPGKFKRSDMTKDDYGIPEGNVSEKVA